MQSYAYVLISLFQYGIFFKSLLLNAIEEIQKISAVSPPLCDEARIVKLMNSHRAVESLVKAPRQNGNDDENIGRTNISSYTST